MYMYQNESLQKNTCNDFAVLEFIYLKNTKLLVQTDSTSHSIQIKISAAEQHHEEARTGATARTRSA